MRQSYSRYLFLTCSYFILLKPVTAQPPDDRAFRDSLERSVQSLDQGRYEEASVVIRGLLLEAKRFGPGDIRIAWALNQSGLLHYFLGRHQAAEAAYLDGIRIAENQGDRYLLTRLLVNLGDVLVEFRRYAEAEAAVFRALELMKADVGPSHSDIAGLLVNLAILRGLRGDRPNARKLLEQALDFPQLNADGVQYKASALTHMGIMAFLDGNSSDAVSFIGRGIELWRQALGPGHSGLVRPLLTVGIMYVKLNRASLADSCLRQAQEIMEATIGSEHPLFAEILTARAAAVRMSGGRKEARTLERRAREIRARYPDATVSAGKIHISDLIDQANSSRRKNAKIRDR